MYSWTDFFTDPLLRAPMIGSIFMCITASIVGVIVLIRKRALVGEALSHAAYPGIVVGAWVFGAFLFAGVVFFFFALRSSICKASILPITASVPKCKFFV